MKITRIIAGIRQRMLATIYHTSAQDIYILMFHEVTDGERPQYPEFSITRENLEKLLDSAEKAGVTFVSVSEIREQTSYCRAVLTFDDVFFNACENAFPLLRKRGIPYMVFVTAEYIGKPGFVTEAQMEEMKQDPLCTIGYHAAVHRMMRGLCNVQIRKITDPTEFEVAQGIRCEYFAFPYGSVYACPDRAVKIVAKQGYQAVFSTICSGISARMIRCNPWFIPRICVNDSSWEKLFMERK